MTESLWAKPRYRLTDPTRSVDSSLGVVLVVDAVVIEPRNNVAQVLLVPVPEIL